MMGRLPQRRRLGIKQELLLALLPAITVLLVLALVEALSNQRLLFASLASSAFLIYLDPEHSVNHARTLVIAQIGAAVLGVLAFYLFGPGYLSAGSAMIAATVVMIVFNVMHPPAVSTALSFGLKAGNESNLVLFCIAVGMTAVLVLLQRAALWLLRRSRGKASLGD